jgi:hypothetical protein
MQRKNVNLFAVFKQKVRKIEDDTIKYKGELEEYEKLIGYRNSNRRAQSKNSFYMT